MTAQMNGPRSSREPPPGMRVGALRSLLADLPDDMVITVRAEGTIALDVIDIDSEAVDCSLCGGIWAAGVEESCDGELFFAIDVSEDEADFVGAEEDL